MNAAPFATSLNNDKAVKSFLSLHSVSIKNGEEFTKERVELWWNTWGPSYLGADFDTVQHNVLGTIKYLRDNPNRK